MKNIIYAAIVFIFINSSVAQDVIELPFKPIAPDLITLYNTLGEIDETDNQGSINLAIAALDKYDDPRTRHDLIYWELADHYARLNEIDKCIEILKKGQEEGIFYNIEEGERAFPPFQKVIEIHIDYPSFIKQNNMLIAKANKSTRTEYMVQLPDDYSDAINYPLLVVLHGGSGSITDLQYNYNSKKLRKEFIVAYIQGSNKRGTNSHHFAREHWRDRITTGYKEIISKYSVDTAQVILAGQSAGGARSMVLGLTNRIPTKGLLLFFPVVPQGIDSTMYINAVEKGLKVAMLCGENDWAIKEQKKLGYEFDKYSIPNRFVVFPDKGHEFPDNREYYLETSLNFIMKVE